MPRSPRLILLVEHPEHANYRGFEIDDPVILQQVQNYIHNREWDSVFMGNLIGMPGHLSQRELHDLVPLPAGPEPLSEPGLFTEPVKTEPEEDAGLVTA